MRLGSTTDETHVARAQALLKEAEGHLEASMKAHKNGDCFAAVENGTRAVTEAFTAREHVESARASMDGASVTMVRNFAAATQKNYRAVAGDCVCQPTAGARPAAPSGPMLEIDGAARPGGHSRVKWKCRTTCTRPSAIRKAPVKKRKKARR